jgi:sigma-B regulation protein RsbU (phosphoserine phosphatase)
MGVIGLAAPLRGEVDEEERQFLAALTGLAASGLANARAHAQVQRLNRRLDQKVHELETILELVRALRATDDADEIARLLGLVFAGQWAVARFVVLAARQGHPVVARRNGVRLEWRHEWVEVLARLPDAILIEALPPGGLRDACVAQRLAALFPLRGGSGPAGLVALGPRTGGRRYTEADLEFGAGLAAQAVVAFENAWHVRELLEKKQLERELALAANIQQGLFPAELPVLERCEVAAASRPARQVGGDYYDALLAEAADPRAPCVFCVADVSGKGIGASLLMSTIQATLRALLGRQATLAELARATNDLLYSTTPGNKYVTAVLVAIDPVTGACRCVNGGHCDGLVIRASGNVEHLSATGLALGLFPDQRYEEHAFALGEGDVLALYSDGVSEALDVDDEEYGVERLVACLRHHASASASGIVEAVLADLGRFTGVAPQNDDITLLVLRRR